MTPDDPDQPAEVVAVGAAPSETPVLAGPGPNTPTPLSDLRAGDVVKARTSDELRDGLDPATAAQLASWFGLPSFTELEERAATAAVEENPDDKHWREVHATIAAAVEPAMIERVHSKLAIGDRLLLLRDMPPLRIERPILLHDDRFGDHLTQASEPRVLEPWNLIDDMKECAPQALLRDLYRPEDDFCAPAEGRERLEEPQPDRAAEVREIMKLRFPMPSWIKPVAEYLEAVAEMRHWMNQSWAVLPIPRPEGD